MFESVIDHLIHNVVPAAADYDIAEMELSQAYAADPTHISWRAAGRLAKRRAAELAIAIDGLTDRCAGEIHLSRKSIRLSVAACCGPRLGCIERVRGVANAYKHEDLTDPTLPITSDRDVLVVALGFGLDAFGVGKFNGQEVIVRDKIGQSWKFLGDAPAAVSGWFRYLGSQNAILPNGPYYVCSLQVHP